MTRVLILYYSSYGHTDVMASALAEGARQVADVEVDIKRVPELVPEHIAAKSGYRVNAAVPIAEVHELVKYDAIVIGFPTRFGRMPAQMANFLDQAGGLWFQDKLVGKVASVFVSAGSQHGGHETSIASTITSLMHFGMTIVGVPYTEKRLLQSEEIAGGSPYGASTLTGNDGKRMPTDIELDIARSQGRHVAFTAAALRLGLTLRSSADQGRFQ